MPPAVVGVMVFGVGVVSAGVGLVVGVVLLETVLGVLQWLELRWQVSRSGWWELASTMGWVVGRLLYGAVAADRGGLADCIRDPKLAWLLQTKGVEPVMHLG